MNASDAIELVQTLVWPVLILILLVVYREPIRAFAKRVTHIRVAGQEFITSTVQSTEILLQALPMTISHPEAVPRAFEADIMQLATTNPTAALIRLRREIDRRIRVIAASGNWLVDFERHTERWSQMHWIAARLRLGSDVQASVMMHAIVEDAAIKEQQDLPKEAMLRLVNQSLTVLGIINSFEFERHVVVTSNLDVFSDEGLTQVQPNRKAVLLRSISPSGQETLRGFLTSRPEYYKPGMHVGYEWRVNPPTNEGDGFVADPQNGAAVQMIGWDFHGRDLAPWETADSLTGPSRLLKWIQAGEAEKG